jgi:hypothetical protein
MLTKNSNIFWYMTLYSLVKDYRPVGGTYASRFRLEELALRASIKQNIVLLVCLNGLFFRLEYGGSKPLRRVGMFLPD